MRLNHRRAISGDRNDSGMDRFPVRLFWARHSIARLSRVRSRPPTQDDDSEQQVLTESRVPDLSRAPGEVEGVTAQEVDDQATTPLVTAEVPLVPKSLEEVNFLELIRQLELAVQRRNERVATPTADADAGDHP